MSNSFEWQTDEQDWPDSEPSPLPEPPPSSPPRRWRLLMTIAVLMIAVGFVVQWQIQQRISTATATVSGEVLAAHNFFMETAARRDQELLNPLLSVRDREWTEAQKTLINAGFFLPRPQLNWTPVSSAPLAPGNVEIMLDDDLLAAELTFLQEYRVRDPAGITQTVILERSAVYRQGNSRWLYSPPLDEFWGGWATFSGERLTLVAPGRDAVVGERLAADLDELLAEMCGLPDMACPPNLQVRLRLETDPLTILQGADKSALLAAGRLLELPAPTLIGSPVDDAGYEFIYRAYGEQLVTVVMADILGYECCRWQRMQDALADWQLAQLGLIPWPMDEREYKQLFTDYPPAQNPGIIGDGRDYEAVVRDGRFYQMRALVEFLVTTAAPQTSITQWQRRFVELRAAAAWMTDYVLPEYQAEAFLPALLQFVYNQSQSGQAAAAPIPYPDIGLNMICETPDAITLHQYGWQNDSWQRMYEHQNQDDASAYFQPVYDQYASAYNRLIINLNFAEVSGRPNEGLLIVDGQLAQLIQFAPESNFVGLGDPSGRYIVQSIFEPEGRQPRFLISDLTQCQPTGCASQAISGWPAWSPDGEFLLADNRYFYWTVENPAADPYALWRQSILFAAGNGSDQVEIGQGAYGTWLDSQRFVYTTLDEQNALQMVTGQIGSDGRKPLLGENELLELIPAAERETIRQIIPADRTLLFSTIEDQPRLYIQASNFYYGGVPDHQTFFFEVRLSAERDRVVDIKYLFKSSGNTTIFVSPNGRWLALANWNSQNKMSFTLHDLEKGGMELYNQPGLQWGGGFSPDGNWFILVEDGFIRLVAPGEDYQELLFFPGANCQTVYWGW